MKMDIDIEKMILYDDKWHFKPTAPDFDANWKKIGILINGRF